MKNIFSLFIISILLLNSCKEKTFDFKYADKEDLFECSLVGNMELIKEAVYVFEDFIKNNYSFKQPFSVSKGYTKFLNNTEAGYMPLAEKFDNHIKEVVYKLKEQETIWNTSGNRTTLNYNSNLANCILSNIQNQNLKNILSSMMKSNTLRSNIFAPSVNTNVNILEKDRALATYEALDMFYAKLFHLDLSLSPVEISKQLKKINDENHASHNL